MVRTTRPNQKVSIANKDTFSRINYIYQAAHLVLTQNPQNVELIRYYAFTLKCMAKKQVLRLHPEIKRTICKKCYLLMVPGITATVRKKGKKQDHMVVRCIECHTPKRFPMKADYRLWSERPEAWFAMFPPDTPPPVPVSSSSQQEGGRTLENQNEKAGSPPGCSHRGCRRLTYCRRELQIRRKVKLSVSVSDAHHEEQRTLNTTCSTHQNKIAGNYIEEVETSLATTDPSSAILDGQQDPDSGPGLEKVSMDSHTLSEYSNISDHCAHVVSVPDIGFCLNQNDKSTCKSNSQTLENNCDINSRKHANSVVSTKIDYVKKQCPNEYQSNHS